MKLRGTRRCALGIVAIVALVALFAETAAYAADVKPGVARTSGKLYFKQRDYDKAAEYLAIAAADKPEDYDVQIQLAISLAELKRWKEASEHFAAAIALGAKEKKDKKRKDAQDQQDHYWAANYNSGVAAYSNKDFDEAITQLQAAIDVAPEKAESYSLLGSTYTRKANETAKGQDDVSKQFTQENLGKAVEYLTIATTKSPGDADTWLELGQTQQRMKLNQDAARSYQSALDVTPADSVDKRMDIYLRLGDMSFVAGSALRAGEDAPEAEVASMKAAKQALFMQAEEQYRRAAELKQSDARAHYQIGLTSFNIALQVEDPDRTQRYLAAAEAFGKAADFAEGADKELTCDALYNMGLSAMNGGDPQRTIAAGDRLIAECAADNPKYYLLRAQGKRSYADQLDKQGKPAEAKKWTEEALADFTKANSMSGG